MLHLLLCGLLLAFPNLKSVVDVGALRFTYCHRNCDVLCTCRPKSSNQYNPTAYIHFRRGLLCELSYCLRGSLQLRIPCGFNRSHNDSEHCGCSDRVCHRYAHWLHHDGRILNCAGDVIDNVRNIQFDRMVSFPRQPLLLPWHFCCWPLLGLWHPNDCGRQKT